MAMAAALLVPMPSALSVSQSASLQSVGAADASSAPRHVIFLHRRRSSDFSTCRRGVVPEPAASSTFLSSATSSSSSGRDGGACCASGSATRSVYRSSFTSSRNSVEFGWRAYSGGLLSLSVSGLLSGVRTTRTNQSRRLPLRIAAEKADLTNVAATLLRVGKQGLEAGTKLVPEQVPRPVAQAGDDSNNSSGSGGEGSSGETKSTDEALEEARRIMDKYK